MPHQANYSIPFASAPLSEAISEMISTGLRLRGSPFAHALMKYLSKLGRKRDRLIKSHNTQHTAISVARARVISDVHIELNIASAIIFAEAMPSANQKDLAVFILICGLKHGFSLGDVHHGLAIELEVLWKVLTQKA